MQFEGDLQGLENRHFHRCLLLRGGAVPQQLWPPSELRIRSSRCFGIYYSLLVAASFKDKLFGEFRY